MCVCEKKYELSYSLIDIFYGGWDLNSEPCIYYALSLPTELSSRRHSLIDITTCH